jgi:hypothetical protein
VVEHLLENLGSVPSTTKNRRITLESSYHSLMFDTMSSTPPFAHSLVIIVKDKRVTMIT